MVHGARLVRVDCFECVLDYCLESVGVCQECGGMILIMIMMILSPLPFQLQFQGGGYSG